VAFCVDREQLTDDRLFGLPVVPFEEVASIYPPDAHKMHIAVGYVQLNRLRAQRYYQAKDLGYQLISYVSSRATAWPGSVIGDNCFIDAYSIVSPSAKIGNNVLVGTRCTIPHFTTVEDHCYLSGGVGLSGFVAVGSYCYIGTGAIIRNNITIGKECVIGAGALILEDTEERSVYMGGPAELLPISSDKLPLG
jgi:sugar O-acyltransferase (sialic acid O-acetyltransferase NeuD family)